MASKSTGKKIGFGRSGNTKKEVTVAGREGKIKAFLKTKKYIKKRSRERLNVKKLHRSKGFSRPARSYNVFITESFELCVF